MDPVMLTMMQNGNRMSAVDYKKIEILRTSMWRQLSAVFLDYDALICPTCAHPAPLLTLSDSDFMATLPDGRFGGLDMTTPFNMVPQCPVLSLPAGRTPVGLPVGLQIVGTRYADEAVLAMASGIELVLSHYK
jgi:Asp-tRNA(Asn)/Glu-tRNA(Gln) amidotransferase A subunit family amidase